MNTHDRRGWHLDKGVSLSHLLTSFILIASGAAAYSNMQSRMAVLESQSLQSNAQNAIILDNQKRIDARQDAELQDIRREIKDNYNTIIRRIDEMSVYIRSDDQPPRRR